MKLKGEMSMLNVLQLQNADIETLCIELKKKVDEAPQFFVQSPLVIDCIELDEGVESIDFSAFKIALLSFGFIPVGIRNIPETMNRILAESGWAIMRDTAKTKSEVGEKPATTEEIVVKEENEEVLAVDSENSVAAESQIIAEEKEAEASPQTQSEVAKVDVQRPTVIVDRTVRSGQQVYAAGADMTVLAATSSGSELMADGSIHIYGPLRGRVLAGARGNESARIYCQSLQAELFAIAGRYQLLDESDTHLKGKPVMIHLEGEKLVIEALS